MDDTLEPTTTNDLPPGLQPAEDEDSEGEEDGGPDWTRLPTGPAANVDRPVIPKRGEKDHEPHEGGETARQAFVLERARGAMFTALRATRTIASRNVSYAVWHPSIARAHVTLARGIHFGAMGHSVARAIESEQKGRAHKRTELLPEEAIYLVERGALFCWKARELDASVPLSAMERAIAEEALPLLEDGKPMLGAPMSVQQAFAEMIGREDLTLEKYQVYAYLKRLGYVVTRARQPSPAYPMPPPLVSTLLAKSSPSVSLSRRLLRTLFGIPSAIYRLIFGYAPPDYWQPLRFSIWSSLNTTYTSALQTLRFIPAGYTIPLRPSLSSSKPPSPYEIFYNIYKPVTPYKKTSPPPSDFSVVVIDARTTPMPTLHELCALYDALPELGPPAPRRPRPPPPAPPPPKQKTLIQRLFPWAAPAPAPMRPPPRPNPFPILKQGKKSIVIAVVDAGTVGFFRLGMGTFEEWPMI